MTNETTKPWTQRLALGFSLPSAALAMIFWGLCLRLGRAELAWSWPILGGRSEPAQWSPWLAIGATILALVSGGLTWRRLPSSAARRSWLVLFVYYSAVFGFVWFHPVEFGLSRAEWIAGAGLLLVTGLLAWPCRHRIKSTERRRSGVLIPVLLVAAVVVPIVYGLLSGAAVVWSSVRLSLLTYPVYAFVQLGAFMIIPAQRLRDWGLSRYESALVCAVLFSLIHWPNTVVMAATFGAMLAWALDHLLGRRWLVSALIMGLAATSFSQFLPDEWTGHMKVGPGLVRRQVVDELGGRFAANGADAATNIDPLPTEFLARMYPRILGREATGEELADWTRVLARNTRCQMACYLSTLPEYRRLAQEDGLLLPPPPGTRWYEAPPEWRQRYRTYGSEEYMAAHGGTRQGVFRELYQVFYRRSWPADKPLPVMKPNLTVDQRRRLVEVLLANRRRWARSPFDPAMADELKL